MTACGLYAIAFATAVAYGQNPTDCNFDQTVMRRHLFHCFTKCALTPFPMKTKRAPKPTKIESIDIHCYCRMPELNVEMIECTKCFKWYYNICCADIPKECLDISGAQWLCTTCEDNV